MSTAGWMSQKRISDLCHSLNETHILVYSFPPSWVSLWGWGNLLRNTKNKVLTNKKSFVRYRTKNFGLERNERRQVLGICKERIKTVLWKGWKKQQIENIFLQASSLLFWSGVELISPFHRTMKSTGEGSKKTFNIYLFSWHTQREFNTGH